MRFFGVSLPPLESSVRIREALEEMEWLAYEALEDVVLWDRS